MKELIYQVVTTRSFENTVQKVQEQAQMHGFRVLHIHDVQATLAAKGFEIEPLKIIEVCNAKHAYTALQTDVAVSLLMPCRINVYTEKGQTVISTALPSVLVKIFDKPQLEEFAQAVNESIIKIVDASK